MPAAPQIFISYRRDDSAGYARAVYDELAREFGEQRVFIDVDDIGAGQAFDEVIRQAVGASQVLLVLIGKRWLGEREGAAPRIHDSGDFVRLEVGAALARGMRVIPLLLDGAPMPAAAQLPEALRPLAQRNALELDNTRFAADMRRLAAALHEAIDDAPHAASPSQAALPPAPSWRGPLAGAALAALAALALGIAWRVHVAREPVPADGAPRAASAAQASANDIAGIWQADVTYPWPNARYTERFEFSVDGDTLRGTASFVGAARGIVDGRIEATPDGTSLSFTTRTREVDGGGERALVHRYRAQRRGEALRFVMQTEGGTSDGVPIEFVARRPAPAQALAAASAAPAPTSAAAR